MTFPAQRLNPSLPICEVESWQDLITATQCTAGYTTAGIIDVRNARALTFFIDADAAAANDQLAIVVGVSNAETQPAAGDDSWFVPTVTDGAVTIGAGAGAVATGRDWTLLPAKWGQVLLNPGEYRFPAFGGASEEGRWAPAFDVSRYRWVIVDYADFGGATRCTVAIKYSRSI
ncbi:MAG TPA: hypothetical protein VEB22_00610 [Phycisphaerales bacterium]|nr:hypothetical protein [Phycisphaerales bacterium]